MHAQVSSLVHSSALHTATLAPVCAQCDTPANHWISRPTTTKPVHLHVHQGSGHPVQALPAGRCSTNRQQQHCR